jgi:nickel-dependent lactate racemase
MAKNELNLRYGDQEIPVDLTGFLRVKLLEPRRGKPTGDLASMLGDAMAKPVAASPLKQVAAGAGSVAVIIPDRTRPRFARSMLPTILDELTAAGVESDKVTIFIASGTHSEHTEQEVAEVVGEEVRRRVAIQQNLARQDSDFVDLGTTSRGTPIRINRTVVDADLKVVVGGVAAHYFAGWGGGRKMILPGSAHIDSAWANHRMTLTDDGDMNPKCHSGIMDGNPVHEDMVEVVGRLDNLFLINVVLDGWGEIADVTAGHIIESHHEAVKQARKLLEVPFSEKCGLAIVSPGGRPLDTDLVQSHKAIDHAAESVRDGGVMIVLAECDNGMGSDTFIQWFDMCDPEAICKKLLANYELNGHTALALMKKLERFRILLVSSLPKETVERTGMVPVANAKEALDLAGALIGEDVLTYVFPCAWGILPVK